jgi:tetratricopeptide (TPR) repeat protein
MAKRSRSSKTPAAPARPPVELPRGEVVRRTLLAALTALLVATPLIPSESPASGTGVLLILLWLLLGLAWSLAAWVFPQRPFRWGWVDSAVAVLVVLHTLSAVVMGRHGDARAAINLLWQWIGFGLGYFLVRQLVRPVWERRALVAVFVSLAAGLSTYACYQYAYSLPRMRAEFDRDSERMLRAANIDARQGSPERKLYEDRLHSTEPFGTFALANSLAGFLAPWLVLTVALGVGGTTERGHRRRQIAATAVLAALMGFCLLLTKSRSAFLAALLGLALLGLHAWRGGRRIGWRVPLIGLAALAVLFAVAIAVGSFDRLVVSEAPKSVLYRLQYWRATWGLIADHPWFGCGPGNFQHHYTAYKLPEASETIAEPHNFLLEIWATAGTPAMLALVAVGMALAWTLGHRQRLAAPASATAESPVSLSPAHPVTLPSASTVSHGMAASSAWWLYAGGLLGLLLAYPCGAVVGSAPDRELLAVLLPPAVLAGVLLHRWVVQGRLTVVLLLVPMLVLYVNLLAAGGFNFAGVAQTGWVLLALVLNGLDDPESAAGRSTDFAGRPAADGAGGPTSRLAAMGRVLAALLLVGAYHLTMYGPVLKRQVELAAGDAWGERSQWDQAEAAYLAAAAADPYSAEPWLRLASLHYQAAITARADRPRRQFEAAVAECLRRNPHSHTTWKQVGDWQLGLYRATGNRVQLGAAVAAYAHSVRLYPNSSLAHAQLAWAYHVAGDGARAATEAEEAWRLDARNPHRERKLAAQQLFEPRREELVGENAEQCIQRLRR